MKDSIRHFISDDEGQDLAEYALLLFLIALVVVVALRAVGPIIAGVYDQIAAAL